jgi:hypothetical protein
MKNKVTNLINLLPVGAGTDGIALAQAEGEEQQPLGRQLLAEVLFHTQA